MLYHYRELPEVMKKLRDYLEKYPNNKHWTKINKILQVYMDNPKDFDDMQVYVKGHMPFNYWQVGSDTIFRRGFQTVGKIEMSTKDWEHLKEMDYKNDPGVFYWFYRANTITKFIDYIYEVYCT